MIDATAEMIDATATPVIRRWHVSNFKSIATADIPLTRLTLLAGANSAGKTSFLQSILLFAQSARSPDEVILNGEAVRLGTPSDVIRTGTRQVTLGFTADLRSGRRTVLSATYLLTLRSASRGLVLSDLALSVNGDMMLRAARDARARRVVGDIAGSDAGTRSLLKIRQLGGRRAGQMFVSVHGVTPADVIVKLPGLTASQQSRLKRMPYESALEELLGTVVGLEDARFFEVLHQALRATELGRTRRVLARSDIDHLHADILATGAAENVVASLVEQLSEAYVSTHNLSTPTWETVAGAVPRSQRDDWRLAYEGLYCAFAACDSIADRVRYLGPLRDEPRMVYQLGFPSATCPVGHRGEFTAGFLAEHQGQDVSYVHPAGFRVRNRLGIAVNDWLQYFDLATAVEASPLGKLGHSILLNVHGVDRDLTTVGVGASQLLPVLVLVLGAPRGAMILLEQPELHLHPALQSRLADFLRAARPDVRTIVETHSEYMVTRLRLRVAERAARPADVSIMSARNAPITTFEELSLTDYGDLSSWPPGFFDAGAHDGDEILRAVARRIRAETADSGDPS